ncbi:MAG: DUF3108 domain-containing protein [Candidatus Woesearchaeota archaeon]|nr:DUF3108 domain-containing protein [Candidatus Woesearchaeota archaeon]
MKKTIALFLAIALISSVFMIIACSGKGEQMQAQVSEKTQIKAGEAAKEDKVGAGKLSVADIYNYGSVHQYEYIVKTKQGAINIKNSISHDSLNGIPAWLQKSEMEMEGGKSITSTWLEKKTLRCLKIEIVMNFAGQEMRQESPCPTTGLNAASNMETPEVDYIGKESVTVPAGTFPADKYLAGGTFLWVSKGVPIPLKIETADGQVIMELVSYS